MVKPIIKGDQAANDQTVMPTLGSDEKAVDPELQPLSVQMTELT